VHDPLEVHVFYCTADLYKILPYRLLGYQSILSSEILQREVVISMSFLLCGQEHTNPNMIVIK